jgi:hypothetical protein
MVKKKKQILPSKYPKTMFYAYSGKVRGGE